MREKAIRVLLVENDYVDREAAKRYLRKTRPPYDLRIAKTESEAMEMLRKTAYDVVLMTVEAGKEAGRGTPARMGAAPLILITDSVGEHAAKEATRRGACDLLVKDSAHHYLEILPFSIRNVLKRKRAELALTASRAEFHSAVKKIPHIIYRLNAEGRITFISDAVKLYGYNPEALLGSFIIDLVHGEDRIKAAYRVNERRTGDRSTKSLELRLIPRDDAIPRPGPFRISAEGIYTSEKPDSNSFMGTQGVAMDVADNQRAQTDRMERIKLQNTLETIRTVCNELSQPLQAILGYSDLLSIDSIVAEELPEVIGTIIEQTRRMEKLMKKLRKIAIQESRETADDDLLFIKSSSRE